MNRNLFAWRNRLICIVLTTIILLVVLVTKSGFPHQEKWLLLLFKRDEGCG
ncbi:hypothetical protein CWATWH8502_1792 [Crocosphaera watsonii WH 8502]|uniref:Uncharacterized protein n=1 Tax=Crocosphaera watsonii WH 8502 TaxID=423474 RepID=T2ID63_CROWT|nr:hypothetical protein CWATWH8502_1792 [Crocosphaera watsonii WH 8502]